MAQEDGEDASPAAPQTPTVPIRAEPVAPDTSPPEQAAPIAMPTNAPQQGIPLQQNAGTPQPAAPPQPVAPQQSVAGPTVAPSLSGSQGQSRVVETIVPERVPVFPDDPDSAWWEVNPHYAFDRAQREQRPLLLLFTGTWNTQAMSLSEEVFATSSFNEYVKENLVICYLNYPRNFTDAPDRLREIKEKFKVKGYPNVLVFNPNGEVEKGVVGYRTGRPIDYFNRLKAVCQPILESIERQKEALVKRGYRDWSNYLGTEIFARFVEHDHQRVTIQGVSGQKWTVSLNDLAPEDQKLVESFPPVDKVETESDE